MILDSGGVLIRPTGGRWFPPPAFHEVLTEHRVTWQLALLDQALTAGGDYLDEVHPVPLADERAERAVWLRYYEIVLDRVGVTTGGGRLAEAITTRWESTISVEPYPWTVSVLVGLEQRGIPVVVLSDAWPSAPVVPRAEPRPLHRCHGDLRRRRGDQAGPPGVRQGASAPRV